jgi:hypothetical protein
MRDADPQGPEEAPDPAMDWFYLYVLGCLVVIAGVGLGLYLVGVPPGWILVVLAVLTALALLSAVRPPRRRRPER